MADATAGLSPGRNSRQRGGGAAKLLPHRGCEAGLRRIRPGGRFGVRTERGEAAARRLQGTLDLVGRRPFPGGLLQLTDGGPLKVEEPRTLLRRRAGCWRLLTRSGMSRDEGAEGTERRGYRERDGTGAGQCAITMTIDARWHLIGPLASFWTTTGSNRQMRPGTG